MKMTEPTRISSIIVLPSEWCDILRMDYTFVCSAYTRNRLQIYARENPEGDNFWKTHERKNNHIWWEPDEEGEARPHGNHFDIVIEEPMITDELLRDKYIPMLNEFSGEQFEYVLNFPEEEDANEVNIRPLDKERQECG